MPRISLTSALLITTYFAVCSLAFVSANAAIGWLIVIATAILIAVTIIRSFQTRNTFGLGFSVFAGFWLSLSLGLAFETSTGYNGYDLRTPIWKIMKLGRTSPKIESYVNLKRSRFHDLYHSIEMIRHPDDQGVPNFENSIRLVACWSALIVGVVGGNVFRLVMRPSRQITKRSTEAADNPEF